MPTMVLEELFGDVVEIIKSESKTFSALLFSLQENFASIAFSKTERNRSGEKIFLLFSCCLLLIISMTSLRF